MYEQMQACTGKGGCCNCKGKACKPGLGRRFRPEEVAERINAIDLTWVKWKLMDKNEGKGWEQAKVDDIEVRYKRFLLLSATADLDVVPTTDIDSMWHYHILDTRAYAADCQTVFGGFFHHFPYFGLRGPEDAANLRSAFEATCELYWKTFGSPYQS